MRSLMRWPKSMRIKRKGEWRNKMRREAYLKMWDAIGSLYSSWSEEGSTPNPPVFSEVNENPPLAISVDGWDVRSNGTGVTRTERSDRFHHEIEHFLSLGKLGLRRYPNGYIRPLVPPPKPCKGCCGLPWHVKGKKCKKCGLERKDTD